MHGAQHHPVDPGEIVGGKYRIENVLGVGGMGVVFAADQFQLGRRVAIKFLLPSAASVSEAISRFLLEARASSRLESEHVVRVLDAGTLPSGEPYLVMELLRGRDLAEVLRERGPLPPSEAINYVLQACHGLNEAHRQGLVHRDLKPQNLFLAERNDGRTILKVLDFGISKVIDGMNSLYMDGVSTAATALMGSPPYMSPEQIQSAKSVDARTDVWALGVLLFELLTGSKPFTADTLPALSVRILSDDPPLLNTFRSDVPAELQDVIQRCLEKNLERRYGSVQELIDALEPITALDRNRAPGLAVSSPPMATPAAAHGGTVASVVSGVTPAIAKPRNSRLPLLIGGVSVAVVLALVVLSGTKRSATNQTAQLNAAPKSATSALPAPSTTIAASESTATPSASAEPVSEPISLDAGVQATHKVPPRAAAPRAVKPRAAPSASVEAAPAASADPFRGVLDRK